MDSLVSWLDSNCELDPNIVYVHMIEDEDRNRRKKIKQPCYSSFFTTSAKTNHRFFFAAKTKEKNDPLLLDVWRYRRGHDNNWRNALTINPSTTEACYYQPLSQRTMMTSSISSILICPDFLAVCYKYRWHEYRDGWLCIQTSPPSQRIQAKYFVKKL